MQSKPTRYHVPQQQRGGGCLVSPYRLLLEIPGPGRSGHQRSSGTSWDTYHTPFQAIAVHQSNSAMDFRLQAKQQGDPQSRW